MIIISSSSSSGSSSGSGSSGGSGGSSIVVIVTVGLMPSPFADTWPCERPVADDAPRCERRKRQYC